MLAHDQANPAARQRLQTALDALPALTKVRHAPPKRRLHTQRCDDPSHAGPGFSAFSSAYSRIRTRFESLSR